MGESTTERRKRMLAARAKRDNQARMVARRKTKGMSNVAIGKEMGISESTVRTLVKRYERMEKDQALASKIEDLRYEAIEHMVGEITESEEFRAIYDGFILNMSVPYGGVYVDTKTGTISMAVNVHIHVKKE